MSNVYNVDPNLKRCDTAMLLGRDFSSEVLPVEPLVPGNYKAESLLRQSKSSNSHRNGMYAGKEQVKSRGECNNEDEDTIYFKPRKIYKLEHESTSRQSLIRVYSETERSNFNEITGKRMYDDLKYRPICHRGESTVGNSHFGILGRNHSIDNRRRFSTADQGIAGRRKNTHWENRSAGASPQDDMQDEYIPDLDFAETVQRWQAEDLKESSLLTRYNTWSEEESDFNLDSPSSLGIIESSHAQVSPIPFPNTGEKSSRSAANSLLTLNRAIGHRNSSRLFSPTNNENKCKRSRSKQDWGSLLSVGSTSSLSDKVSYEDIKAITDKIPEDFLMLPYTQRKKILLEIAPEKDYRAIMTFFKKYNLRGSNSFTKLHIQGQRRSRHGSMASQYLSSFTPSSASFKPDDRGSIVLGHLLGKIIGFGAWGMIRDCYDVKENSGLSSSSDQQVLATKAIKIVRFKNNMKVKQQVLREISIWKKLHHPNILELINWKLEDDYAAYCLTGKIKDGNLFDLVSSWGECTESSISLDDRCKHTIALSLQIVSALKYMHSNYVVHADVKLENCLLEKVNHDSWKVYLCDFGMSCHFGNIRFHDDDEPYDPDESIVFASAFDGKLITTKRRPSVPKSVSNSGLKPLTKLQKLMMNKQLTHDDTPVGISAFPKQYGPSLTSTTMSASYSTWKTGSPVSLAISPSKSGKSDPNNNIIQGMEPHSHIGSLPYAAPELIDPCPPPLGPSADVWAVGVTLYTMLTGKLPFKHEYEPRLRAMISSGKYNIALLRAVCNGKPDPLHDDSNDAEVEYHGLYNSVRGCLTKDITQRWELDMVNVVLDHNRAHSDTL